MKYVKTFENFNQPINEEWQWFRDKLDEIKEVGGFWNWLRRGFRNWISKWVDPKIKEGGEIAKEYIENNKQSLKDITEEFKKLREEQRQHIKTIVENFRGEVRDVQASILKDLDDRLKSKNESFEDSNRVLEIITKIFGIGMMLTTLAGVVSACIGFAIVSSPLTVLGIVMALAGFGILNAMESPDDDDKPIGW